MKEKAEWKSKRPNAAAKSNSTQWTTFSAVAGLAISLIALSWGRFDTYELAAPKLIVNSQSLDLFREPYLSLVIRNASPNSGAKFKATAIGFLEDYIQTDEGVLLNTLRDVDKKPVIVHLGEVGPGEDTGQYFAVDGLGETSSFRSDVESGKRVLYIRVITSYRDRFFVKHLTKNCYVLVDEVGVQRASGVLRPMPCGQLHELTAQTSQFFACRTR